MYDATTDRWPHALLRHGAVFAGWFGALCVLGAYLLLLSGRTSAVSATYLAANVIGSLGLTICALQARVWQAVTVNALWMIFGLRPLADMLRHRDVSKVSTGAAKSEEGRSSSDESGGPPDITPELS